MPMPLAPYSANQSPVLLVDPAAAGFDCSVGVAQMRTSRLR